MSSRRGTGEDNILAMLERDSTRRSSSRGAGIRLAWYGAAAALVGIFAGGVAWLAFDNHETTRVLQAHYDAAAAAERAAGDASMPSPASPSPVSATPMDAPPAAAVVDERTRVRSTPPPMVMLAPHEASSARPPAPAAPREQAPLANGNERVAAAGGPATEPIRLTSRMDRKPAKSVRTKGGTAKRAPQRVAASARAPARPATAASAKGAARPPARAQVATAARARNSRAPTATEQQVDSDVALISAIISQSERHRGERGTENDCSGATCTARPARR